MSGVLPFPSRQERDQGLAPAVRPAVRRSAATLVALFTLHVARGDAVQRATDEAVDVLATLDSIGGSVAVDAALGRQDELGQLYDDWPGYLNEQAKDGFTPLQLACYFGQPATVTWLLGLAATVQAWR